MLRTVVVTLDAHRRKIKGPMSEPGAFFLTDAMSASIAEVDECISHWPITRLLAAFRTKGDPLGECLALAALIVQCIDF
jgi:hypothetical protein